MVSTVAMGSTDTQPGDGHEDSSRTVVGGPAAGGGRNGGGSPPSPPPGAFPHISSPPAHDRRIGTPGSRRSGLRWRATSRHGEHGGDGLDRHSAGRRTRGFQSHGGRRAGRGVEQKR